jgi:hypothetical protein
VASGPNAAAVEKEAALAPLRQRRGFQEVLGGLKQQQTP